MPPGTIKMTNFIDDELKGKRFLQVKKLANRWDCSTRRIYDLISKGYLRPWHPEGKAGCKGLMVEVSSILKAEKSGFLDIDMETKAAQAGGGGPQPEPNQQHTY